MANFNYPICTDDGKVIGRDVVVTEQLPDASVFSINPAFLVVGLFHPISDFNLQTDPLLERQTEGICSA